MTYPFPNFNGAAIEVWELISIFIPHFIIDVISYPNNPCQDLSWSILVKVAPWTFFWLPKQNV